MSDGDEHNEGNGGVPMELFWLGNLDEGNKVDADYLDEDARQHLAGLTKIGLGTQLVDFAEGEAVAGKDDAGERIEQAADALDFADEDELIEDASAPAPVSANYAAVGAALATGLAAEDEDYDYEEEEAPEAAQQPASPIAAVPVPQQQQQKPLPPAPSPVITGDPTSQVNVALSRGIHLPTLSKDLHGDSVLAFTDLFRSVSKQSSSAAQQRGRRVRFSDSTIASQQQLRREQQAVPPTGDNELNKALLLFTSGSKELADLGIDVILQKEEATTGTGREGYTEDEMRSQQQQQGEEAQGVGTPAAAAVEGGGALALNNIATTTAAATAVKDVDAAGTISSHLSKQQKQQQRIGSDTTGPSFAVLPPCVFDPVIQQIWELKINNNTSGNGSVLDRGVNDTSSEHETDEEEEEEEGQPANRAAIQPEEQRAAGTVAGDGDVEMAGAAAVDSEQQLEPLDGMEEGEPDEEEEEENEEAVLARKLAAERKAAREDVTAWGAGVSVAAIDDAPDSEDVVNVLHTAPLLRYSNPLKALFPRNAAAPAVQGGEEAGTSTAVVPAPAAVAGPSTGQQQLTGDPTAPAAAATVPTLPEEEEEVEEENIPALRIVAASRVPTWESDVILEGGSAAADRLQSIRFTLDLNDPGLVLQNVSRKTQRNNPEFKKLVNESTATVIPYQKRAIIVAKGVDSTNEAVLELAKINISRDNDYFAQPKRRAGSGGVRAVHHAKSASELVTIPLSLDLKELMLYHRPRGFWWPLEPAKGTRNLHYPQHSTVIVETLPGASKLSRNVELATKTPEHMWEYLRPLWKLKKDEKYPLPLFLVPGKPRPAIIPADRPLNQSGIPMRGRETMEIVAAYREVEMKPTSLVGAVPDESNSALLRPPMAFTLFSDLRAGTPGRVVLVEYLQDAPLLLNRPGMGARLATYYRRKSVGDTGHQTIRNTAATAGQRWRVGAMNPINEDDESPFLGEIEPGAAQLSVETGLFTVPAAPHAPLESDFLLTRGPSGYMSVREITGSVASGQQLPLHRIPVPGSRDLKDLEERLVFVHVFRVLKERKLREERRLLKKQNLGQAPSQEERVPTVSLKELSTLFPSRPQTALRICIKDMCGLILWQKDSTGDEFYRVPEGARMPSEPELRRKFTPEDACVLEACRVAEYRMQQSGLLKAVKFNYGNVAADKLRLAAEMLPPDELTQAAAKAVEAQYITAAWNLTDAFMSSFREGRATMRLLGPGDPTGRGVGYSFERDVRHKGTGNDDPTKAVNKQRSGKVQGTDADLRRMTTEQAKKKLIDFGLDEAEIDPLGRWVRIDLVRQLANASAADGSVAGIAKYVRHQKTTLIELQKRYRERAQEIFNRQISVLNDSAAEELGDQAALEAELEAELAAEERGDEGGEPSPGKKTKKGGRESSPAPEDEARQLEEMRAAGLLGSSPADANGTTAGSGADGAGPSTSAAPAAATSAQQTDTTSGPLIPGKTRRIRREVLARSSHGSYQKVHEVIYAGRDRPFLLASLYQKEGQVITGPWGFGHRVINAARIQQRLSYSAAKGRGMGRGRGRGGSRGGRGSRGGGRGRRGRSRSLEEDYDRYDGLDMSAVHVGPRNTRRTRAVKKKADDFVDDDDVDEILYKIDYEDIESEIEEDDDEEFDANAEQLAEDGIIVVKEKKKAPVPRVPRQPKPVELDAEGNPVPKKPKQPKQPKKEKAPLTEEQLEKQRQRQQREASPQFYSGREFDEYLREEGALEDDDEPAEVLKTRVNRVREAGIINRTSIVEPVFDVAPVEWDPNAPSGAAAAAAIVPASAAAAVYQSHEQWSDEDYHEDEDDDDDEEYIGEGRRRKRTATGGSRRRTRGGTKSVAPVPQPTRASSRSAAAVGKKRSKYGDIDTEDDEEYDEDYGSDMTDSPSARRRRRSSGGGGGGGGTRKKSKTTGGYTAPTSRGGVSVGLVAGAKALGTVFVRILDLMKKEGEAYKKSAGKNALTYFSIFGDPVSLASVPDYRTKVPESKSMWLKKIRSKAVKGEYYDVESAMKDFRQIQDNAKAYNDALSGGKFAFPRCIEYAEGIVGYVEEKLQWPENEHAVALALEQIAAAGTAGGGDTYDDEYGGQGGAVEDLVVAFDPSANYSLEALPVTDPATVQPVSKVDWVLCEKCKAWRITDPGINSEDYFECSMKRGFSCETPLEPGGTFENGSMSE